MLGQILAQMNASETDSLFRPVRCLQADIESRPAQEGFLYFTTDTRKIYYGNGSGYDMMGGSSGVFYGSKILKPSEKDPSIKTLEFYQSDIEGSNQIAINDLILNIPDGGFYRVVQIVNSIIYATRIAVSGSGGDGSTPDSGSGNGTLRLSTSTPTDFTTLLNTDYFIKFKLEAYDPLGALTNNSGTAILYVNEIEQERKTVSNNEESSFNVSQYIKNAQDNYVFAVRIIINAGGGGDLEKTLRFTGHGASLSLDWSYSYENAFIEGDTFTLRWTPRGSSDGCTTYIVFDDKYNEAETIKLNKGAMNREQQATFDKLAHGTHTIEMWLDTTVNGVNFVTDHQKNEIACIDFNDNSDFLMVPYYETTITQYDTVNIPYYAYTANNTIAVQYYVNDREQLEAEGITVTSKALNYWPCTITDIGNVKLKIALINGKDSKELDMVVKALDLSDLGNDIQSVFELRANAFANNDTLKSWKIKEDLGLSFSDNFDWDNGGIKTEIVDGFLRSYICVKNGSRMTINYPLFANTDGQGKEFKIIFKTANCQDYEAEFLKCANSDGYGITMNAQQAVFKTTSTGSGDSNVGLITHYAEHSYVEYEAEIWPNGSTDKYLMTWIDGVPNQVAAYSTYDFGYHNNKIIIGSDKCDVHIYLIKVYETNLSIDNHMRNFIMDAPNSSEIMKRYNRNNIIENNEVSWNKLVKNNPGCRAYLYDVEAMPYEKSKTNRPKIYSFAEYVDTDERATFKATDAQLRVQGTSSAAYGLGAFNLDTNFKNGVTDNDGNPVEGYVIAEGAIPVDYTCTKVNVASCENANNALNQEWYNRFQPYHDAHRRKGEAAGKNVRDCMQFNNGVIFVKDHNPNMNLDMSGSTTAEINKSILHSNVFFDTPGYDPNNPYYKQYAIGNMGNSKDNVDIFHDTENPLCACVEIPDNNNEYYQMQVIIPENDYEVFVDEDGNKPEYEFRYPDGNDEASKELKDAWIRFVRWMALRNPIKIYQETEDGSYSWKIAPTEKEILEVPEKERESVFAEFKLSEPETFEPYTFKGFAPPKTIGEISEDKHYVINSFSNESILGDGANGGKNACTISTYAGTYNYNTVEYRMAKMLEECEDYLVMDSVIYHYLFIEAHTMIDNVAKNTFWSTEDGLHWDLTKNYDNDTADGIDNNGRLRFNYGLEPLYIDENGNVADSVFNADECVWLQFIGRLTPVCRFMYTALNQDVENSPWNYSAYLKMFKDFQNLIPERVWIEDYIKKYLRPHRLYSANTDFLEKLEGGKKTSQRESFEKYQNLYLSTKYNVISETTSADRFYIRVTTTDSFDKSSVLKLKYYIDCYTDAYVVNQILPKRRINRGEEVLIPIGQYLKPNTTENIINIPNAGIIQELLGLSGVYPAQAFLADGAKLNGIEIGSEDEGYLNSYLNSFTIPKGELLETLNIANSGADNLNELDLSFNTNLKSLIATNSKFPRFALCKNGLLRTLKLNAVNSLELDGYSNLEVFTYDNGIYDKLISLNISNCNDMVMGAPSYNLALNSRNKPEETLSYQFLGVKWEAPAKDATHIEVLDKLLTKTPITKEHSSSLTGSILVDNTDTQVNQYGMYRQYSKQYPNVVFNYVTDNLTNKTLELKFLKEQNSDVVVYRVLTNGQQNVQDLISGGENSPLNKGIDTPYKDATSSETFSFTGYWIDVATGKKYYNTNDWSGITPSDPNAKAFSELTNISVDMTFYPEYRSDPRKYGVTFRDYNTDLIYQNGEEFYYVAYGQTYDGPIKNYYYREPDKSLLENERYAFKGWSLVPYGDLEVNNPDYFDLATEKITKAITLYAHYGKEDCTKVASNPLYFNYSAGTISIKEEYATELKGKISLPATDLNKNPITKIGNFNKAVNISHIFILSDKVTEIRDNAFGYNGGPVNSTLEGIYWKTGITKIGSYAFNNCKALKDIEVLDSITSIDSFGFANCAALPWTRLPKNLMDLGIGAFQGCSQLALTDLPQGISTLNSFVFSYCPNLMITQIPKGTANGQFTINQDAFSQSGSKVKEVFIPKTVKFTDLRGSTFNNYGDSASLQVYLEGTVAELFNDENASIKWISVSWTDDMIREAYRDESGNWPY